jgi:hypothetical protein
MLSAKHQIVAEIVHWDRLRDPNESIAEAFYFGKLLAVVNDATASDIFFLSGPARTFHPDFRGSKGQERYGHEHARGEAAERVRSETLYW